MIGSQIRAQVRERAQNACEYCHLHQDDSPLAALHVEHIIPKIHGGSDDIDNLALACIDCNLHKGTNLTGIDPETNELSYIIRGTKTGKTISSGEESIWQARQPRAGLRFGCSTLIRRIRWRCVLPDPESILHSQVAQILEVHNLLRKKPHARGQSHFARRRNLFLLQPTAQ